MRIALASAAQIIAQTATITGLKHVDDTKIRAQKLLEHLNTDKLAPVIQC